MKFMIVAVVALAVANASVIPNVGLIAQEIVAPIATGTLVQGPSTKTHVVGPDGSQIVADAPGGTILANDHAAIAAVPILAAPIVAETVLADPVVEVASPIAAKSIAIEQAAPVVANAVVEPVVVGSPIVAKTIVASSVAADGYPLLAAGSGIEGQYVPDNTEKLYDDGTYKGDAHEEGENSS